MKVNQIAVLETNELRSILLSVVSEQLQEFKKGIVSLLEKSSFSDEYLSRKEAAEFLKISETTLWSLDKNQELPATRLRGKVLYLKSSLLDFSQQRA